MGIKIEPRKMGKMVPKTVCKEVMVPAEEVEENKKQSVPHNLAKSGGSVKKNYAYGGRVARYKK